MATIKHRNGPADSVDESNEIPLDPESTYG